MLAMAHQLLTSGVSDINIDSPMAECLPYLEMLVNAETPCGDVGCVNTKDNTMAVVFWNAAQFITIKHHFLYTSAYSIKYSEQQEVSGSSIDGSLFVFMVHAVSKKIGL